MALESDDISAAIVLEGSVPVRWTNDPVNPWVLSEDGTYIQSPEGKQSTLTMTYSSKYMTDLSCLLRETRLGPDGEIIVRVDGEERFSNNYGLWTDCTIKYIPAGEHTVEFVAFATDSYSKGISAVDDVMIREYKELESACLKEGSLPLTFQNGPDYPFLTCDGYIECRNNDLKKFSSTITTTFTIDQPSIFSFDSTFGSSYSNKLEMFIDGDLYLTAERYTDWRYCSIVLEPGTHTIQLKYIQTDKNNTWCRIRNVRLDQTWYDITLNKPGELGLRLLQQLGDKNLQDAELVKITGQLNSDDLNTLTQLTGIHSIDFSDAGITAIPKECFKDRNRLSRIVFPDMLESIESGAFNKSGIHSVIFGENPVLSKIDNEAFYNCDNLREFIMPNSVTTLGTSTFYDCDSIRKLHFSDRLISIPGRVAYDCRNLSDIKLPVNLEQIGSYAFYNCAIKELKLPESLNAIGENAFISNQFETVEIPEKTMSIGVRAFENCPNLKELKINSIGVLSHYIFLNCRSLIKIIVASPTPPQILSTSYDPFDGLDKSQVELIVPDFALASYKADPYWYNFTGTRAGDEASLKDYWRLYGNLILSPGFTMRGTPDVEMMDGSSLTIDNQTSQHFKKLIYWNSETNPARFLSNSSQATADTLDTHFYMDANKWCFFAPVCDVKMSDITHSATDSWIIRYYDGARRATLDATSGNWVNMPADGVLRRGEGYIVQANKAGWIDMPVETSAKGAFFAVDQVSIPLKDNACATAANAGWNFVANPYPTYYDIYYIDMQAPITVWTGSTYRAYSLNDGDRGDDTYVLRPMQPFFVQKADADLKLRMPLFGRQTTTIIDRNRAPRRVAPAGAPERHKLNLELWLDGNAEADDYSRVVLNESASLDYEADRDASKFMSLDMSVAQIYTLAGDQPMAINERPYADGNVGLGVYLPAAGKSYSISATRIDGNAWLYDSKTGIEHDLSTGAYMFTADKSGVDNTRFSIRFVPSTSSVEDLTSEDVRVAGITGAIEITAPAGAEVTVYTIEGAIIDRFTADGSLRSVETERGIYVVTVNGLTFKTIVK